MDITIEELKESTPSPGAVLLVARLSFERIGQNWLTVVRGQGRNRAEAAEALVKNPKLKRIMVEHLKAALVELGKDEPTGAPKVSEPSSQPVSEGQDQSSSPVNAGQPNAIPKPPTSTQSPSSTSVMPPNAQEAPQTPNVKRMSTPAGTPPEKPLSPEDDPDCGF